MSGNDQFWRDDSVIIALFKSFAMELIVSFSSNWLLFNLLLIVNLNTTYNYQWKNVPVSEIMTKNIIKLNLSDELTKAEELFKSIKLDTFRLLAITK
jgi:hypothetical protein